MTRDLDLLVLAELNPDVVVAADAPLAFGQVEQLVERAAITLGSSGAITACAAAALGLRVAICGVVVIGGLLSWAPRKEVGTVVAAIRRTAAVAKRMVHFSPVHRPLPNDR